MAIKVTCDQCDREYKVKDESLGKKFKCKDCGTVLVVAHPKKKKQPAVDPSNPFDGLDEYEDDYGDEFDDDYEQQLPPAKKKAPAKKKSTSKKKKKSAPAGGGLPPMTFNLNRINALIVLAGGFMIFYGIQELRLAMKSNSVPVDIAMADLLANGPGENVHFTVSDVIPTTGEYIANENQKTKRFSQVWIPCTSSEGKSTNFILYSNKAPTEADVDRLMETSVHSGMIINDIQGLKADAKKLLRQGLPGINVDTAYIFQVDRKPSGFLQYAGFMIGGLVIALGGMFWIFFVHSDE